MQNRKIIAEEGQECLREIELKQLRKQKRELEEKIHAITTNTEPIICGMVKCDRNTSKKGWPWRIRLATEIRYIDRPAKPRWIQILSKPEREMIINSVETLIKDLQDLLVELRANDETSTD